MFVKYSVEFHINVIDKLISLDKKELVVQSIYQLFPLIYEYKFSQPAFQNISEILKQLNINNNNIISLMTDIQSALRKEKDYTDICRKIRTHDLENLLSLARQLIKEDD